jgi:hypothetical protein
MLGSSVIGKSSSDLRFLLCCMKVMNTPGIETTPSCAHKPADQKLREMNQKLEITTQESAVTTKAYLKRGKKLK